LSYEEEPNTDSKIRDMIDLFSEGSQDYHETQDETGKVTKELVLDPEKIYWSTKMVNSPFFGHYVKILKKLESLAYEAEYNMCKPRAEILKKAILALVQAHKSSIDAKASETFTVNKNVQGSLLHLAARNKIEKQISVRGDKQKAFLSGLFGTEGESERDGAG
jgi:hypothetical protein